MWRWALLTCAVQATFASAATNEFLDMSLEELVDYRLMSMSRKEQRVADMAAAAYVIMLGVHTNWIQVVWAMMAAASLTLGIVHLVVWFKQRSHNANLTFFALASSVAVFSGFELAIVGAQTPAELALWLRWAHVPIAAIVVLIVIVAVVLITIGGVLSSSRMRERISSTSCCCSVRSFCKVSRSCFKMFRLFSRSFTSFMFCSIDL